LERFGLETYADTSAAAIPYGISKKVSVARSLMSRPSLLLLDEPASGLDESELEDFSTLIRDLRLTTSVLLVEHNMDFVMPLVDRLVVLNFGTVIATGTAHEVVENPEVIAAYLGASE
jgi:branched-chain amino acid transport system ATP-binding protein